MQISYAHLKSGSLSVIIRHAEARSTTPRGFPDPDVRSHPVLSTDPSPPPSSPFSTTHPHDNDSRVGLILSIALCYMFRTSQDSKPEYDNYQVQSL